MRQPALPFADRRAAIYRAIDAAAHEGTFTASEVRAHLSSLPFHPNDIGRAFRIAKERGFIKATGEFRKSTDKSARGRMVQVWRKKRTGHIDLRALVPDDKGNEDNDYPYLDPWRTA